MNKKGKANQLDKNIDRLKFKIREKLKLFDPVIIYPFIGYSNGRKSIIPGRILERKPAIHSQKMVDGGLWTNIKKAVERFGSDEIPYVQISAKLKGQKSLAYADEEGYFKLEFSHKPGILKNGWYDVAIEIEGMPFDLDYIPFAKGEILVCNQTADFGIISDVDDTVIKSHATNTFKKVYTMLMYNSKSRISFKGVDKLYKLLINKNKNPLFFVSGSSYNLYDLLVNFCAYHSIPKAPFLLRNPGLDKEKWFKQETRKYKVQNIEGILKMYPKLSFILIGDSGQQDPEIYNEVCRNYPQQVKAVFIRHVDGAERKREIESLADTVDFDFLVMDHSKKAIEHVKKHGWV